MVASDHDAPPRIYTLAQIEEVTSAPGFVARLLDAITDGFVAYSAGRFNACPIQTMGAPPMAPFSGTADGREYAAQTCVKSGYVTGAPHYCVKVASGGHPFPNSGSMQLYSQRTGRLEALLLDEGILTELRTAAAGAVAARLLAPALSASIGRPSVEEGCIGILGTGVQARYQLRMLSHVTTCREFKVWGRTEANVQTFITDMTREGWDARRADSPQELLEDCSLIVTTTSAREPLLELLPGALDCKESSDGKRQKLEGERRPLHITCIGSDATGKAELDPALVATADLLVADSRGQTQERGEYEEALQRGLVSLDSIVELGELVGRKELHRKRKRNAGGEAKDCRLTVFDSSGVAVQDCMIAALVYEALVAKDQAENSC